MPSSKITSKGQITLPKAVRELLGVRYGDRVHFRIQKDGTVFVEPETVDPVMLRGHLRPRVTGVTLDAIAQVIGEGWSGGHAGDEGE